MKKLLLFLLSCAPAALYAMEPQKPRDQKVEELLFNNPPRYIPIPATVFEMFQKRTLTMDEAIAFLNKTTAHNFFSVRYEKQTMELAKEFSEIAQPGTISFTELETVCAALYAVSGCNIAITQHPTFSQWDKDATKRAASALVAATWFAYDKHDKKSKLQSRPQKV